MAVKTIKSRHAICLTVLFTLEMTLATLGNAKVHAYQGLIIAFIIIVPFLLIYQALLNKNPGKTLFEIIDKTLWKWLAKIILILYILLFIYMAASSAYTYIAFIIKVNINAETNTYFLIAGFILISYLLKSGLTVIGKIGQVFFVCSLITILFFIIISVENIMPIYFNPIIPYYIDDFLDNIFLFVICPLGESFLLFNVFSQVEQSTKKKKLFFLAVPLAFLFLLVIILNILGTAGEQYVLIMNYPYYSAVAIMDSMRFITRIESFSVGLFCFAETIKTTILIYSLNLAIKKCFKIEEKRDFYLPLVLFIFTLTNFLFSNLSEVKNFFIYYCYAGIFFYLFMPTLLLIMTIIKKWRLNYKIKKDYKEECFLS